MIFSVLTLFPDLVAHNIRSSITGRALERGLFSFFAHDIRDFAVNDYGKVDDSLYGGGKGMLMMCEPIYRAWLEALQDRPNCSADCAGETSNERRRTIYLSPKGRIFDQRLARELAQEEQVIFLCGHYEGVDQRVLSVIGAEEVSLGDFVITGGELAASIMMDAIARMLPGVLPASEAFEEESHYRGRLECRQYTKPAEWQGLEVPAVLQSGHHARIERWRRLDGLSETYSKRPDLFAKLKLDPKEGSELAAFFEDETDV